MVRSHKILVFLFVFLSVFMLISIAFSVAMVDPVTADENWEPDNEEVIYLPKEEEEYYYNYTDKNVKEEI